LSVGPIVEHLAMNAGTLYETPAPETPAAP
jgi:hypothetical protein